MERAPFSVDKHWTAWEEAAAELQQADRYCSSPYWGLPLMSAFMGSANPVVYRNQDGMAVFHEVEIDGIYLHVPCDSMWTLGNPILSLQPAKMLQALCDFWESQGGLHQVTISGLYQSHPLWRDSLWRRYPAWERPEAGRQVASLAGGAEGFLSRRSVNFRSRLRRAVKKAEASGVEVEPFPKQATRERVHEILARVFRIEAQSWKGQRGQGIDRGSMASFYRSMLPLLSAQGRLRGLFLRRDGRDLSYLFGASFAGYFRGLQFSYLESESEADSLGNIGQWKMIQTLCEEGCQSYDLGQAMAYKTRWAEDWIVSPTRGLQVGSQGFEPER